MTQSQEGKTKMVASHDTTHMTKQPAAILVAASGQPIPADKTKITEGYAARIKTIRACADGDQLFSEDCVLDCTDAFAKEFCDNKFDGPMNHWGETLQQNAKKHEIVRAIRLS